MRQDLNHSLGDLSCGSHLHQLFGIIMVLQEMDCARNRIKIFDEFLCVEAFNKVSTGVFGTIVVILGGREKADMTGIKISGEFP